MSTAHAYGDTVALRRADGEPDQLPRRDEADAHHDQDVGQQFALRAGRRIEQRLHTLELCLGKIANLIGQSAFDKCQGLACRQDRDEVGDIRERLRRSDLADQPPTRTVVADSVRDGRLVFRDDATVKIADEVLADHGIVGDKRPPGLVAEDRGFGRRKVATDPGPDPIDRAARDATALLLLHGIADQERLGCLEEQLTWSAAPRRWRGFPHGAAHLLEQRRAARDVVAARGGAFKLRDQLSPYLLGELPQIIAQPFNGEPAHGVPPCVLHGTETL